VVDATNIDGRQMYQRDPRSTIAACGVRESLASHEAPGSYLSAHGTSFATPTVSGLAANILSLPETEQVRTLVPVDQFVRYLKAYIESLTYPRVDEGPNVAWNGVGRVTSELGMDDDGGWGQTFLGFVLEKLTQAVADTLPVKVAK
jgi:subtilisin family serine protease